MYLYTIQLMRIPLSVQVYKQKNGVAQTADVNILFNDKSLGLHKWDVVFPNDKSRYISVMRRWTDEMEFTVERPGPLRPNPPFPTEPKAENQNHGLPFVNGQVHRPIVAGSLICLPEDYPLSSLRHCTGLPYWEPKTGASKVQEECPGGTLKNSELNNVGAHCVDSLKERHPGYALLYMGRWPIDKASGNGIRSLGALNTNPSL